MPMPRSLPCCADCALRAAKPDQSATSMAFARHPFGSPLSYCIITRRLVGIGFLRDHVAAADLNPVDAHLCRRNVDQPLEHESRLRPSSTAISVDRHGVGENHLDLAVDGRRGVDAGKQWTIKVGRDVGPERRDVAAEIGDGLDPQSEKLAVGVERELSLGDVIAAVSVRDKSFAALAHPLDRPPDLAASPGHHGLLGVVELLHAESAADIGCDHPQLLLRDIEHEETHEQPHHVRKLARRPQRVVTGFGMEFRDRRARLHRVADKAVVHEIDTGDMGGLVEGGLGGGLVAEVPVAAQIVGHIVVHERGVRLERIRQADDGRQHVVIHHQRVGRVACLSQAFGDHEGDSVADVAHLVLRHGRMRRLLHRLPVLALDAPAAGQSVDPVSLEIGAGEYGKDSGHGERGARIDRLDPRMRVRRAHENAEDHPGPLNIGDVIAAPGQEAEILLAARGSANSDHFGHGSAGRLDRGESVMGNSRFLA